jgi:tripartite-type tricarboxylate transporter receptor subunit TctC
MNFHRITPLVCGGLAMLMAHVLAAGSVAQAQNFPSKQINVIVGTGPGDPGDMIARLIQSRMVERFGQSWVVDNRPAASGKIGSQAVARSAPDGHTLLVVLSAHAVNPAGAIELPYDTARDFAGISLIARQPMIIAVHPTVKGANLKEFIEAARANPSGKLAYSSPGVGTLSFLVGEQIVRRGGLEMPHVPFRGGAPAIQALLANEVQLTALIPAILMPHIKSGAVKPLAVTSDQRLADLPDVPTLREMGFDIPAIYNWMGFFAPAATPPATINLLNKEITAALTEPATAKWLADTGFETVASTPAELDRFVVTEIDRWRNFVKEFNVRFD